MKISGLVVTCEATATTGWSSDEEMATSEYTVPSVMLSSSFMSAGTGWKPVLGPPVRTSMSMPVSTPPATSEPFTFLALVSIVLSGPTRLYAPPCSASGCQSSCTTTVGGHTPLRFCGPSAGAAAPVDGAAGTAPPPEQAASSSAAAMDVARDAVRRPVVRLTGAPGCQRQ